MWSSRFSTSVDKPVDRGWFSLSLERRRKGTWPRMNEEIIWREIMTKLADELGDKIIGHWFNGLRLKEVGTRSLVIESPNAFISDWVKREFYQELNQAAAATLGD
jgi:hypothetical protein